MKRMMLMLTLLILCAAAAKAKRQRSKATTMAFYMQEQFTGRNKTLVKTAGQGTTYDLKFGQIGVLDDPITQGPSPKSKVLGKMQGSYTVSSQDASIVFVSLSAVFQNGSISIVGSNQINLALRYIPVVGGTASFYGARGVAAVRTLSIDNNSATFLYKIKFVLS